MWKSTQYNTSKVTLELRELVENGVKLWDFEYPSYYKGAEKTAFEQKVIDHYFFRQIGQETVGRFLHMFRSTVREIMPRYLDMYRTVELMSGIEDPFGNVDIVETFEEERTGTNTGTTTGTGTTTSSSEASANHETNDSKVHIFSNTPQGEIENIDHHMSEATKDTDESSDTTSSSSSATHNANTTTTDEQESSGTVKHTLTRKGNQGVNTYAHDIIEFRQSLIDVDMMIIKDLNHLFLGVY